MSIYIQTELIPMIILCFGLFMTAVLSLVIYKILRNKRE